MNPKQPIICLSSSNFFLLYAIFVTLATATISTSTRGNETDHAALLSFKSMIHDPYGALVSWNHSLHFCNWHGVYCGKRHKRVTALQLNSTGLEGCLSPHIGNLSFLHVLNLRNNGFQGTIPHELGRLSRLRILNLETNNISGSIPTNLSGCFNLEGLGLHRNMLVGNIPKEISFLSKLTKVTISYNRLTGGIPPSLGNLTSMRSFSASENPFGGTIPETLGHWKNLIGVGFGGCNLHGTIPHSIYNLSLLQFLSFPENDLTGSLPPAIGELLPNLELIQVGSNKLTGLLPPSISNCSKLQLLELVENSFFGKLTIDFAKLRDIQQIFLSGNDIGSGEADDMKFIDSLKNCSILRKLELEHCKFQGMVPISVGNLSHQLSFLNLEGNKLYGNLPSGISNLAGLKHLYLDTNRFTGKIPSTIGMLQNLGDSSLYENQFSGPIPEAIGNLSSLTKLDLGSNRLEGHIPTSLGNCQNLLELYLGDNKLNGTIPKQLLQLSSLSIILDLSYNNLFGSLPSEVGDLKMLTALDISYNNISGNIPDGLAGCTSLTILSLEGNLFQGMLSQSLSSLRGLEVLDVSQNKLSGPIPGFLEHFQLQFLNLSFNDFEGDVPVVGVFSNASDFSVLGNSKLCGGLVELGLSRCKETKKHEQRFHLFIIVILVTVTLFFILSFKYVWHKKNRQVSQTSRNERFLKVSYNQLLKATDGFSEANLIGKGGFSSVYKGTLEHDDKIIAVKVLHLLIRGAHKSFIAECEAWRNIRHRNLLKIITSCSSVDFQGNDFKAIIYEFMPNGSLHDWLHSSASESRLSLLQRVNILIDVSSALDYLHNQCLTSIAHGDLKPSNILLDNDMMAHVGDFGLARFLGTSSNQHSSTGVKGTIGYAAPEYGQGSKITGSGDVYSFGILLLEVMTRKKPTDDIFDEGLSLHKFVCASLPDNVIDVTDERAIVMQCTEANAHKMDECLASILKIGVSCSVDDPSQRMNIKIVVQELVRILNSIQNL